MSPDWQAWALDHWQALVDGVHVDVAAGELSPPSSAGFERLAWAEPLGQDEDWGLSLSDGSRLHVHRWTDGSMRVHRDRIDPARGVVPALRHFVAEAPSAKVAMVVGGAVVAGKALRRLLPL